MSSAYVSYADVKLPVLSGDFSDYLERVDPIWRWNRFEHQYPDADLLGLPIPQPIQPPPNWKLGTFFYPCIGAQAFGRASFIVNEAKLTAIRAALVTLAGSSSAGYVAAPFVLANEDGDVAVTTNLLMLPPLPLLGDSANADRLYLITLVDKRWSWWQKSPGLSGTLTTWSGLVTALETALGETITVAGSFTGYAAPSSRWSSLTAAPLPYLLDAVAHSTGRRVVLGFDGSVTLQDYDSAVIAAALEVNYNDIGDYRRQGGGSAETVDLRKVVPATLRVRGAATNRDVTLSSLSLTDYSSVTGRSGHTATLHVDATSLSLVEAQKVATDWYNWQLAGYDQRAMARFCAVTPNACWGSVEFTISTSEHATRWYAPPLEVGFSRGSDAAAAGSLQTVNSDGSDNVTPTTKIIADLIQGVNFGPDGVGARQLLSVYDASPLQTGVVNKTLQEFDGIKYSRAWWTMNELTNGYDTPYSWVTYDSYVPGVSFGNVYGSGDLRATKYGPLSSPRPGQMPEAYLASLSIFPQFNFPDYSGGTSAVTLVTAAGHDWGWLPVQSTTPTVMAGYYGYGGDASFSVLRTDTTGGTGGIYQYVGQDADVYITAADAVHYRGGLFVGYTPASAPSSTPSPTTPPTSPSDPPLPPTSPPPPPTSPTSPPPPPIELRSVETGGIEETATQTYTAPTLRTVYADRIKGGTVTVQQVILVSPNGTAYAVTVDDSGTLVTAASDMGDVTDI